MAYGHLSLNNYVVKGVNLKKTLFFMLNDYADREGAYLSSQLKRKKCG